VGVSLLSVLEGGEYDLNTIKDATWLLGKQNEFEELIEKAQDLVDSICPLCGEINGSNCNNGACDE